MGRFDVIAVGDVVLDVEAAALPSAGDRLHAPVSLAPGGSSLRAAAAAARAGALALCVGRVGDDEAAGVLRRFVASVPGLEAALAVDPAASTGLVVTLPDGAVVAHRGASAALAPADLPEELAAGALLVSGYALLQEGARAGALAALERAAAEWVAVDLASSHLAATAGRLDELGVNAVFAAEAEAERLEGDYRLVCVKRGAAGATLLLDGERLELPPGSAPFLGDGDALAGTLLARLALGLSPTEPDAEASK